MKSDLALISESISSSALVLSSFCFAVSASLNYNKDNDWKIFFTNESFLIAIEFFDYHWVCLIVIWFK